MKKSYFLFLTLLTLPACDPITGYKYNEGRLPAEPVNLGAINSADDDYNSDIPVFGELLPLIFSSKRGGKSDFDFVRETLNYNFDRKSGRFSFDNKPYWGSDIVQEQQPITEAVNKANSGANELGPYVRSYDRELINDGFLRHYGEYLMLFASDRGGSLDIFLTHNFQNKPASASSSRSAAAKPFTDPAPVSFLNSPADDAYPTFDKNYQAVYFTSNRQGSFDIFRADLTGVSTTKLHAALDSLKQVPVEKVTALSGAFDDKCPYVQGDILVFTSNRPGGFGGFDLYYSQWEKSGWSEPVNFGPAINSAYDEYRPILREPGQYRERLLLFSSNRPGGKGGFDLYLVGVPK